MVNLWSKGGKYGIEDFLPVRPEKAKPRQQTAEEMYLNLRAISMRPRK
jgi:hypothetical protein